MMIKRAINCVTLFILTIRWNPPMLLRPSPSGRLQGLPRFPARAGDTILLSPFKSIKFCI